VSQQIRFAIHRFGLILTLLFCTVGCDQVTKQVVRDSLPVVGTLSYFGGHLKLDYARNSGAFMSMGAELPTRLRFWIFNVMCATLLGGVGFVLFRVVS